MKRHAQTLDPEDLKSITAELEGARHVLGEFPPSARVAVVLDYLGRIEHRVGLMGMTPEARIRAAGKVTTRAVGRTPARATPVE